MRFRLTDAEITSVRHQSGQNPGYNLRFSRAPVFSLLDKLGVPPRRG